MGDCRLRQVVSRAGLVIASVGTPMPHTVDQIFPVPRFVKRRPLRQTWLKDVGWHEAPGYREHLGLAELADFLEVAGARLDYVKLLPAQIINAPRAWLERKIATYHGNGVATYFDHYLFPRRLPPRHRRAGDRPGRRAWGTGHRVHEHRRRRDAGLLAALACSGCGARTAGDLRVSPAAPLGPGRAGTRLGSGRDPPGRRALPRTRARSS